MKFYRDTGQTTDEGAKAMYELEKKIEYVAKEWLEDDTPFVEILAALPDIAQSVCFKLRLKRMKKHWKANRA